MVDKKEQKVKDHLKSDQERVTKKRQRHDAPAMTTPGPSSASLVRGTRPTGGVSLPVLLVDVVGVVMPGTTANARVDCARDLPAQLPQPPRSWINPRSMFVPTASRSTRLARFIPRSFVASRGLRVGAISVATRRCTARRHVACARAPLLSSLPSSRLSRILSTSLMGLLIHMLIPEEIDRNRG